HHLVTTPQRPRSPPAPPALVASCREIPTGGETSMRKLALIATVFAAVLAALAAGTAGASAGRHSGTTLVGAGSSFVAPLVSQWIPAVGSAYGYELQYSPIGSGGGITAVTTRAVDFGASDA